MFEKITPEQAGISSDNVTALIKLMEKRGCATHGIIMMKGGKVFAENYWAPFHQDFCHRLYSQTKSFVSVAIGLLVEEGKVKLEPLQSAKFAFEDYNKAYEYIDNNRETTMKVLIDVDPSEI
jgi:hypothetical protein